MIKSEQAESKFIKPLILSILYTPLYSPNGIHWSPKDWILAQLGLMLFLVAVLITKNVDYINWTLNWFEFHQYLISLLSKTQQTEWNLA
jgi:hypothetical protein